MEPVKLTKEQSSLISEFRYDEATWALDVHFHNGNAYTYSDVGPEVYADFVKADSKGSFYNRSIKGHFESFNHKDMPAEMPEPKVTEGNGHLRAALEASHADPSWPPQDVMDAVMGDDALEIAGAVTVSAPEPVALMVLAPVQEVMAKLSDVGTQLAVLNKKSATLINREFKVVDQPSYDEVQATVKAIKAHGGEIVRLVDPVRDVFYRAYEAIQTRQKEAVEPLNIAMRTANAVLNAYDDQKTREAQERQRKADAEAARVAEEARRAESQRLTLAAVDDHLIAGNTEAAERLFAEPIEAPSQQVYAERVYSEAPAPKGVSKRKNWKGEVTDLIELILDVAEGIKHLREHGSLGGHAPATFLEADTVAINQAIKGLEANAKYPGIRAFNDAVRSTRV